MSVCHHKLGFIIKTFRASINLPGPPRVGHRGRRLTTESRHETEELDKNTLRAPLPATTACLHSAVGTEACVYVCASMEMFYMYCISIYMTCRKASDPFDRHLNWCKQRVSLVVKMWRGSESQRLIIWRVKHEALLTGRKTLQTLVFVILLFLVLKWICICLSLRSPYFSNHDVLKI